MTRLAEETKELEQFESMLRIDPNGLDGALAEQAEVMWRICKRLRFAINREAEYADEFKRAEGDAFASGKLDGRTDKESEHAARNDPGRKAAWLKWQAAKHDKAGWEYLLECWKSRGFSTQAMGDLYASEYFTKDSHTPRRGPVERPRIERHDYTRGSVDPRDVERTIVERIAGQPGDRRRREAAR